MMKQNFLNSLALITLTIGSLATPLRAQEIQEFNDLVPINNSVNTSIIYDPNQGVINIYVPPPEIPNNGSCQAFLQPSITGIINKYKGKWGVLVESLNDGQVIYTYNADSYLIPASNVKLFTTAAALNKLNPDTPIRSTSLRQWINVTNQRSNNAYAETLLRFIGGSQAAKQSLTELGVDPNSYRLADGSGLSRNNVATPRAIVNILRGMNFSVNREVFLASLPVAGVSGTLTNRMRKTAAEGTVHAKTGTLTGVRALSGYIDHPSYGMLIFSIMVNQPNQPGSALVKGIDDIVLQLARVQNCS